MYDCVANESVLSNKMLLISEQKHPLFEFYLIKQLFSIEDMNKCILCDEVSKSTQKRHQFNALYPPK